MSAPPILSIFLVAFCLVAGCTYSNTHSVPPPEPLNLAGTVGHEQSEEETSLIEDPSEAKAREAFKRPVLELADEWRGEKPKQKLSWATIYSDSAEGGSYSGRVLLKFTEGNDTYCTGDVLTIKGNVIRVSGHPTLVNYPLPLFTNLRGETKDTYIEFAKGKMSAGGSSFETFLE